MTTELMELADWLAEHKVTHVAMESTGVYWKPVYNLLEDAFTVVVAKKSLGGGLGLSLEAPGELGPRTHPQMFTRMHCLCAKAWAVVHLHDGGVTLGRWGTTPTSFS